MAKDAKVISISAKCSDCCTTTVHDEDGEDIFEGTGYVPDFMPGEHFGDYLFLDIDLATGKILNWVAPSQETINAWVEGRK